MFDNVISLPVPHRRQSLPERAGRLLPIFAECRRNAEDVFWLKENAELLNILECTGSAVERADLCVHAEFYAGLPEKLAFLPQYYRFLLSMCLDLEDLGLPENSGEKLCQFVAREGLPEAEFSDLQRAEARRLLARRNICGPSDLGLNDRLRAFMRRSATFALPNKKAAYELTHIVFYLSEYGRCDPLLDAAAITSLEFAGVLAFLDQNMDLLAEICIALRFAGEAPNMVWEEAVLRNLDMFSADDESHAPLADDYHEYLVSFWLAALRGDRVRGRALSEDRTTFHRPERRAGPLRTISATMMQMEGTRSPDWSTMRPILEKSIDESGRHILSAVEASTPHFEAFFEGFARTRLAV
ncbi:MAG: hypothetical protein ACFB11_09805 [Paracoccaceae bacterium]